MNLVLIGYRGTGKSVVGALVAERLGLTCISMDARIVEKAGMSIPEYVEANGWPAFRDLETEVARELAGIPDSKRLMIAVALGYPDPDFPANQVKSEREPVDSITTWIGF